MKIKCRVIIDKPHSAAYNMAADLYLLSVCALEPAIFLRFYKWEKPSISLGCMQKPESILDKEAMTKEGVTWVRRPTGGRAVLHYEDITYSCVFSKKIEQMGSSIAETYALISKCLIRGLEKAGISCSSHQFLLDTKNLKQETKLPCYLAPNRSEIMVNGRKLIGSAQKRTEHSVLQHGSVPLTGRFRDLPLYQKLSDNKRQTFVRLLKQKCICIEECVPSYKEKNIVENLVQGFSEIVPFEMYEEPWSKVEEDRINAKTPVVN